MNGPQSDSEELLGALMPFVQQMLTEHGEFYPVGAVMADDGEITLTAAADNEDDQPESADLIRMFETQFASGAKDGEFKATAIIYDALTIPPDKDQKQDTIICVLDHREDYSVKVCFPYKISDGEIELEDPFAVEGEHKVFGRG